MSKIRCGGLCLYFEQQRDAAHDYAKAHGYHIIKEYEDHAISGTIRKVYEHLRVFVYFFTSDAYFPACAVIVPKA